MSQRLVTRRQQPNLRWIDRKASMKVPQMKTTETEQQQCLQRQWRASLLSSLPFSLSSSLSSYSSRLLVVLLDRTPRDESSSNTCGKKHAWKCRKYNTCRQTSFRTMPMKMMMAMAIQQKPEHQCQKNVYSCRLKSTATGVYQTINYSTTRQPQSSSRTKTKTFGIAPYTSSSFLLQQLSSLSLSSSSSNYDESNDVNQPNSDEDLFNELNHRRTAATSNGNNSNSNSNSITNHNNNNNQSNSNSDYSNVTNYNIDVNDLARASNTSSMAISGSNQGAVIDRFWSNLMGDWWDQFVTMLAKLSLEDYKWRLGIFRQNEADRMMEVSLARMRGENASYIRPMDAVRSGNGEQLGPLGQMEYNAVTWLLEVIDEESKRAQAIVDRSGKLIRPLDIRVTSSTDNKNQAFHKDFKTDKTTDPTTCTDLITSSTIDSTDLGPLGRFEKSVVEFFQAIKDSEEYRVYIAKAIRPKDVEPSSYRGPLGEWEYKVTLFLRQLRESEELRYHLQHRIGTSTTSSGSRRRLYPDKSNKSTGRQQLLQQLLQQQQRDSFRLVRPIDVPGPLGELEMNVGKIIAAEQRRVQEHVLRPKDATLRGPLGDAETAAVKTIQQLNQEEMQRLKSIQRSITEMIQSSALVRREKNYGTSTSNQRSSFLSPMDTDQQKSVLNMLETVVVGIVRGPILVYNVIKRVYELLFEAKVLDDSDQRILDNKKKQQDKK